MFMTPCLSATRPDGFGGLLVNRPPEGYVVAGIQQLGAGGLDNVGLVEHLGHQKVQGFKLHHLNRKDKKSSFKEV